jgi:hypothetical protein
MDNNYGSDYDRLLGQLNEEMGQDARDVEKEIRMMFEDTDMGRQLDINEWDVVFEQEQWWVVANNGSQWSVTETENAETPFQFDLVSETNESVNEEDKEEEEKEGEEEEKETTDDFLVGGEADGAKDNEFDPGQLRMGQHHELEHTDNPAVALEIAKDHLREDPLYYTKLKRMEAGECDHPEDEDAYKRIGHGKHKEE